mgnify:CR=1 FL=1
MLTYQDCLGLCACNAEEIRAIAQHEHLPEMIALELSEYLVHSPQGVPMISRMILDDIETARELGDQARVEKLQLVLQHFIATHPDSPFAKPQ